MLYEDLVGPSLSFRKKIGPLNRVQQYYGQEDASLAKNVVASSIAMDIRVKDAPHIDLPIEEESTPKITMQIPYRKLLEVTHFHLFTIPVFLLILTHLFLLTGISAPHKHAWILLGWLMGTWHLFVPWLIRILGNQSSWMFPLSGSGFAVSSLVLLLGSLISMWKKPVEDKNDPKKS